MEANWNSRTPDPLMIGVFGAYLLTGACYSFVTEQWFPLFPPQLDISLLFGSAVGIYVEAGLASIVGAACLYLAVVFGRRSAA